MQAKPLEAVVRRRDGVAVIDLSGDVTGSGEGALNEAYARAIEGGTGTLVLNFSDAQYINSTGVALIVGLLAKARRARQEVVVWGLSPHYQEVFRLTRLTDFMTLCAKEDDALRVARSSGP